MEIFEKKDVNGTYWGRINQGWICMKFVKTESGESAEVVIANGVVNADDVKIRKTAGGGTIVGTYKTGDKISIVETVTLDGVLYGRTDKGWVCLLYVTTTPELKPDTVVDKGTVTAATLNIRKTPGDGAVVGTYAKDAKVEIYEKKTVDDVVWGRTSKGWICLKYVKTESGEPAETVIAKGTVNTDDVKIRSTPDTGAIVGTYKTGDKVSFFEKKTAGSAEWGRTDKGWVCLLYVTME